jgi:Peptidase A4 family
MFRNWSPSIAGARLSAGLLLAIAAAGAAFPAAGGRPGLAAPGRMQAASSGPARGIRPGVPLVAAGRPGNRPLLTSVQSANWSGYAATGATFRTVSARWVQPRGRCAGGHQYASFWVGLDGYTSSTVEQTGTEVDCAGRSARYYAWYELFPRYPVNFRNRVRPGDHFVSSVTARGAGRYSLSLADTTRGWRHTISATLPGAANSSAEIIAEAPSGNAGVLPLTDFGTVRFTRVTVNGQAIGYLQPVMITMTNDSGQARDMASGLSKGSAFTITWLHGS